jgi:hypothetical protein
MSIVAPRQRKHLSADALFRLVRRGFDTIPEPRPSDAEMACTDVLMSACAMFSLTSPSLLAVDKPRAEGTVGTIYCIGRAPCDTPRRERLAPVSPKSLPPLFTSVCRHLPRGKAREPRAFLDGHSLLARDGTGSFSSTTMPCASCLHKVHRNGSMTYDPQLVGAAIIPPDCRAVIPLRPAPIVRHDGTDNNDGERTAATRCLAQWRQDHPHVQCLVTEDRLSAHAPHMQTLHDHQRHALFGVKEGDHAFVCSQVQAAEPAGRVPASARHDRASGIRHRCRLVNDVPLNASNADVRVKVIESGERGDDTVQPCRWVTDLRVSTRNVLHLMRGGRARWKMANETCTTLKNQGDNFEHTDGHGTQHLSVVFAMGMLLAFVVDQAHQRCCPFFRAVWAKLGSKRLLWERMRTLLYDEAFALMRQLCATLLYGFKKCSPILARDSS